MAINFTDTMTAFEKGIEKSAATAGVKAIAYWEKCLEDVDTPGVKGISDDLASLRKCLEMSEPDSAKIKKLLGKLGASTTTIAGKANGSSDKLEALGKVLSKSGTA